MREEKNNTRKSRYVLYFFFNLTINNTVPVTLSNINDNAKLTHKTSELKEGHNVSILEIEKAIFA